MPDHAVSLRVEVAPALTELAAQAVGQGLGGDGQRPDLAGALRLAADLGHRLPVPAQGDTVGLWEALATLGAVDLTVARAVEPHLDALSILDEARRHDQPVPEAWPDDAVWGVYAAEGPHRLEARPVGDGWVLSGEKLWCSLAEHVTHALVTAWVDDTRRGLFAVDLADPGVRPVAGATWVPRGLAEVRSSGLELSDVPAAAVGEPGWYLQRPGFAWGGAGVAAVWYGGAVGVARRLRETGLRREPDQVGLLHLGAVDTLLTGARAVLLEAARVADRDDVPPPVADLTATRVRQAVADAAEEVLARVGRALGPGPLATDETHARRVADLTLYLRQHHGERDLARQGAAVLEKSAEEGWSWW